jgi:uncharacterized membrane protein
MSFTPPGDEQAGPPSTSPPAPPVPGWWLASDGNWYPPQAAPPGAAAPTPYGPPPSAPYGYTPYAPAPGTNGLAIASLVLGILWLYWIGSILAIIFGFVAMGQIKQRNQGGKGLATAGLILGFIGLGTLILVILLVAFGSSSSTVRFSSVRN